MAPSIRTGVLLIGFLLGTLEVTLWVMFYTFRVEFRHFVGYSVNMDFEEDLTALSVIVGIDLVNFSQTFSISKLKRNIYFLQPRFFTKTCKFQND